MRFGGGFGDDAAAAAFSASEYAICPATCCGALASAARRSAVAWSVSCFSRCTAARARYALGRRITAALLEEMRMRTGARQARLVLPTDPDIPFDAARLIVDIEPNGRVVGVRCS